MEYKLGHQLKNNCLVGWYLLLGRGFFPYEKKEDYANTYNTHNFEVSNTIHRDYMHLTH